MLAAIVRAEAFTAEVAAHQERWRVERSAMLARHRRSQAAARAADRADIHALEIEAEARGERLPMLLPSGVADSSPRVWAAQRHALTLLDVGFDATRPRPPVAVWLWLQRLRIWQSPGQRTSTALTGVPRILRGVRYRSWRSNRWVRVAGRWHRDR